MHWQQKENPGGAVLTQLLEFLPFLSGIYVDSKSGTKWMHSSLNASLGADGTPQLAAPSIHPSIPREGVLGRAGIAQPFPGPPRQWLIPAPLAFLLQHHNTGVLLQQQIGPLSLRNNDCCW